MSDDTEDETLQRLNGADIAFIDFLDAWIDKGLADGTLTLAKAAYYREAIAARCAQLGEVPHRQEHIARLDLKAGDILALIAPSDSQVLMRQMSEHTKQFLQDAGVDGVEVVVFPRGTEIRILDRQPAAAAETSGSLREDLKQVRDGSMTADRFRAMLAEEVRLGAAMRRTYP